MNRSAPLSTFTPVLTYPDVAAAVAWLGAAYGFSERIRIDDDHRAQLRYGDGDLILAGARGSLRPPRDGEIVQSVMVRVDDARAHHERARDNGAKILMEPTDMPYGERQYQAEDLAGHKWTFTQTLSDVAPEQWGGRLV